MPRADRERLSELVRERAGTAGHMLDAPDVDRFVATIERIPDPPATVLDIGCGTGVLVDVLADLGYEAVGIDSDPEAMAEMQQPHVVGLADDLPAGDSSHDIVVLNEVLEHLPVGVFERSLTEAARVAARRIIVTVPNAESLESASTRCPLCGCVYSIHGHVRRFDAATMPDLFPGFRMDSLSTVGPYKLRHRLVEWSIRRRLLGRWPAQPGSTCPQCAYQQPRRGSPVAGRPGVLGRIVRWAYAVPWQRWWLVAEYGRDGEP